MFESDVSFISCVMVVAPQQVQSAQYSVVLSIQKAVHLDKTDGDGGGDHIVHRQRAKRQRHRVGAVEACAEPMTHQRVFWQTLYTPWKGARATGPAGPHVSTQFVSIIISSVQPVSVYFYF